MPLRRFVISRNHTSDNPDADEFLCRLEMHKQDAGGPDQLVPFWGDAALTSPVLFDTSASANEMCDRIVAADAAARIAADADQRQFREYEEHERLAARVAVLEAASKAEGSSDTR